VLEGYDAFMRFDVRELALIEPLRTLRMLHHSAWLAEGGHLENPADYVQRVTRLLAAAPA